MSVGNKKTKREEILVAAAILFRQKGYAATSMRDLARQVGMEAASLYNHIKSKQEILEELLLGIADMFIVGMEKVENENGSALEKIEALIALHIEITLARKHSISLITQEWRHLNGEAYEEFNTKRKDYENRFKNILVQGMDAGEIKKTDPDIAIFSILSTMRWFYAWYSKKENRTPEELKKEFCEVLIKGIQV